MSPSTPDDATEVRVAVPAARHDETRFTPGSVVAGRYRIVSLLGGGGMGEVYRADDLKLGQRVALKYVPQRDSAALERLYAEVRIGRQIAHPNVCRLYDVIEVDGQHFISMEYVDGEDLASLLRRIGRLPADKALALTRDICSGLAAAHDRGYIHRDLKPANIMIDGRGSARITDFGLASLAAQTGRSFDGTPLYMAPEQLEHGLSSTRSDIYALGLVLFEMFTGRRVFEARTTAELRAAHALTKTRPSSLVSEVDPAVERVILRCLDENPDARPSSVVEILAQLPGGDPLTAVVAAGETPSPDMLVAAGRAGDVSTARGWTLLVLFLVLLVTMAELRWRRSALSRIGEVKSPETLRDRARDVLRSLGYARAPHSAGFFTSRRQGPELTVSYVYRDSTSPLVPLRAEGRIALEDPPLIAPGMSTVTLDAQGSLRELRRVAPPRAANAAAADWRAAFAAAGLDPRQYRETAPEWSAPVPSDRRQAWTRVAPGDGTPVRVEAASAAGRPVWFSVDPAAVPRGELPKSASSNALALVLGSVPLIATFFARRNSLRGRTDARGAVRIAAFSGIVYFAGSVLIARHNRGAADEWRVLTDIAGTSLYFALVAWIFYLAIEPYVRRRWPHMLVAWTRLIGGRWRDPLVGTEILGGLIAGTAMAVVSTGCLLLLERFTPIRPYNPLANPSLYSSLGVGYAVLVSAAIAVTYGFGISMLVVLCRLLLRRTTPAWIAAGLVVVAAGSGSGSLPDLVGAVAVGIGALAALRFGGMLACIVALFSQQVGSWTPFTFAADAWYFPRSTVTLLLLAGLGVYAFVVALGGKPLFGSALVEDEAGAGR